MYAIPLLALFLHLPGIVPVFLLPVHTEYLIYICFDFAVLRDLFFQSGVLFIQPGFFHGQLVAFRFQRGHIRQLAVNTHITQCPTRRLMDN